MKRPTSKMPVDMALALSAARDAVGDEAAVQRVRTGVLEKIARGATPPAPAAPVTEAWLGKSLAVLLLTAGAGTLLYNQDEAPPPAASTPQASAPQPPISAPAALKAPTPPEQPEQAPATTAANPPAEKRARRPVPTIKPAQPTAAAAPAPCADAVAEADLISRAQQTLRSQPRVSLTLLSEHAQRFSCGVLALERDTLRIDAERALGLFAQAEQHARELVAHYPDSLETRALKKKLGTAADSGIGHKPETVGTPTP